MNVLILSASSKVLLLNSFREAVAPLNGKVYAADTDPASAAFYCADKALLVPRTDSPEFDQALVAICKALNVGLIVPTRDGELRKLSEMASGLRELGVQTLVAPVESLDIVCNTYRFQAFCEANGFPVPRIFEREHPDRKFPILCRAADRTLGHPSLRTDNDEELSAYCTLFGKPAGGLVFQEWIGDPEYSIDALLSTDGTGLQAVARRRIYSRAGESWKSRIEDIPALTDLSLKLVVALRLVGHVNVQAFYSEGNGVRFIEVNARFGGASNLSISAGLDSPKRLLQMFAGDDDGKDPFAPHAIRTGSYMLRHAQDILVDDPDRAPRCVSWNEFLSGDDK